MRILLAGVAIMLAAPFVFAAGPPMRKPLDAGQRSAVLTLMNAADTAQAGGTGEAVPDWEHAVLKSSNGRIYIPFRITLRAPLDIAKSPTMYVRAVSRRDGVARTDEQSTLRQWVIAAVGARALLPETVVVGPGEMPVGGPGVNSSRRSTQQIAESHTALELQARAYEREKAQRETARPIFPFEEYYFLDFKGPRAGEGRIVERALALLPGEYDLYVGFLDRADKGAVASIFKQTVKVPDFWNDRLALSSLILVRDVHQLKAPFAAEQQVEHPFAFGQAEVVPVAAPSFTPDDPLSVVYQICNYGAPDSDLRAEYTFYRDGDGGRRLFNRTAPQQLTDADLPPSQPWSNQAFTMQTVSLKSFPPGRYELEVVVRDRLTQGTASGTVAFTVGVR
jgi:hypothetical protein